MFDGLGIEWASTLLGCLAVLCVPIPVCFYLFGKKLRQKSKFAPTMKPKPPPEESSEEEEEDDPHDNHPALHASKSVAHHDLPMKSQSRATGPTNGNGNVIDDVEKNLSAAGKKTE
jgi:DHA1 family multidrug resistance protein-like MFS transporter